MRFAHMLYSGLRPAPPADDAGAGVVDEPLPLVPDEPDDPLAPEPDVAEVGTACEVQEKVGVAVELAAACCEHMTTRFLVVSMYQVDPVFVVLGVVLLLPLLLGMRGM